MPAASDSELAPGAGHGDEGDASSQGPAQETDQAPIEALPASPKPTHADQPAHADTANSGGAEQSAPSQAKQAEIIAVNFASAGGVTTGLVTAHPKPAKRLNAKARAQEKYKAKYKEKYQANAKDGIRPDTTAKTKSKAAAKVKRKKDRAAS